MNVSATIGVTMSLAEAKAAKLAAIDETLARPELTDEARAAFVEYRTIIESIVVE